MPAVAPALLVPLLAVVRDDGESAPCSPDCIRNWKIGFSAILIAEGLLFAHLIFIFRRFFAKSPHLIDRATIYGHAVSAGIFLATGFMHILPEAVELLAGEHGGGHSDEGHSTDGAQNAEGEHDHGDDHDDHDEDHNDEEPKPQFNESRLLLRLVRALTGVSVREEDEHDHGDEHGEEGHKLEFPWAMFILLMAFYMLFFIEKIIVPAVLKKAHTRVAAKVSDEETESDKQRLTTEGDHAGTGEGDGQGDDHGHDHEHGMVAPEDVETMASSGGKLSGIMSFAFLIAATQVVGLSAHSLFESIALGIGSSITRVVNIFIATVTHRWATALALSVILSRRVSYVGFIALIALFTLVVPIGVGIGAGISGISDTVQGVLFAISAGTFLYIGVIEGLGAAFSGHHKENRILLFMATFLGSAFIIVVTGILVAAGVEH